MTRLRKQNGRQQPWKVALLGPGQRDGRPLADGPSQRGRLRQVRAGSRQADEVDRPQHQADRGRLLQFRRRRRIGPGGTATVLDYLKQHADYLSLHTLRRQCGERLRRFPGQFAWSWTSASRPPTGIIDAAYGGQTPSRRIYIAWDEWNVWYRARGEGKQTGRRILEEHYNLEDALVVATFLNSFVNHAARGQDRQHGATGQRDRADLHQ